jgi:ribosome maturation factor RimP
MIGSSQEWAFARSFLLGSLASLPRAPKTQDMPGLNESSERRFVRETGLAREIADLATPVLDELGFRLVRVTVSGRDGGTVQLMAERQDGQMTIDDCASISRKLSVLLETHDPMPGSYRLEVSSPGVDRPLVRPSDFASWAGHVAKIELNEPVDGRKRFRGVIEGVAKNEVRLKIELPGEKEPVTIGLPFALIVEAKLVAGKESFRADLATRKRAN